MTDVKGDRSLPPHAQDDPDLFVHVTRRTDAGVHITGAYLCDDMLANVCKHHVTKIPYEIGRLAQDLAGGLMVTLPSQKDLRHPELGALLEKYLKGRKEIPTESRLRILRLIENMTLGRNAVGYLTESLHGAGSPQAQRIQIARQMQLDFKKALARELAGIDKVALDELHRDFGDYFARVFARPDNGCANGGEEAGDDT